MSTYPGPPSYSPMQSTPSYSAVGAISPAIQRTREYLFRPFQLGRFVKIALIAAIAEGGGGGGGGGSSFRSPFPNGGADKVPVHPFPQLHLPPASVWVPITIAAVLLMLIIGAVIGYLVIRLRFSFFECVLDRHDTVAVGWRKYKTQAWRYFIASFCIGLGLVLAFLAVILALFLHYRPLIQPLFENNGQSHNTVNFGALMGAFAILLLSILLMALVAVVVNIVLSEFILPRIALDDASVRDAFVEVWDDIRAEPGEFFLFMLMRLLVPVAASIVAFMVLLIPLILLIVIGVVIALVAHAAAHSWAGLAPLAWPAMHLAGALIFMISISISGTIGTWTRTYGILFYASRYPALGKRLWPAPPGSTPPVTPAAMPS